MMSVISGLQRGRPTRLPLRWVILCMMTIGIIAPTHAQENDVLITWTINGELYRWQAGDEQPELLASNGAVTPYLSPDGSQIAFTAGDNRLPQSLWLMNDDGVRELVNTDISGDSVLAEIEWANENTLYYNTTQITPPFGANPQNDLYRVEVVTGETTPIFTKNEGGAFSISPDGQWIAIVHPGEFDPLGDPIVDGTIRLYEPRTETITPVLSFPPVVTNSHQQFYPDINWIPDSIAFYTAIPPGNLYIEPENPDAKTDIWRGDVNGSSEITGSIPFGYYSLPIWSASRERFIYILFPPSATLNNIVYISSADTSIQSPLFESRIANFRWGQSGKRFLHGDELNLIVGEIENPNLFSLQTSYLDAILLDDNTLIHTSTNGNDIFLHITRFSDDGSNVNTHDIFHATTLQTAFEFDAMVRS